MIKNLLFTVILSGLFLNFLAGQDKGSSFKKKIIRHGLQSVSEYQTSNKPYTRVNFSISPFSATFIQAPNPIISLNVPKYEDGFFCKQERIVEKSTKTAVRFRIGTFQDTRALEYGPL